MKDPIVEEIRKARQDHAREFNHNLKAICEDLKKIENKCGDRLISLPPKMLIKSLQRKTGLSNNIAKAQPGAQPDGLSPAG